ncbi:unnamed protein product [Rangifer tarandus platyrhynchus]|uniref:Uncharacterized protein n=2 Tax=Rangifer tarandus platyrhynchus TaxID=3082113 RepID=A0ACB0EGY6_RANTA|nr:unnamed protein product [Rangifer tarandus platyrhynchus]CAI9699426.1 unnamed protein product [Rangifer tarandus platyrhynchus]
MDSAPLKVSQGLEEERDRGGPGASGPLAQTSGVAYLVPVLGKGTWIHPSYKHSGMCWNRVQLLGHHNTGKGLKAASLAHPSPRSSSATSRHPRGLGARSAGPARLRIPPTLQHRWAVNCALHLRLRHLPEG